jgi:putative cell wall-binding protein
MSIPKAPFESLALDSAGPLSSNQKCDLILVVLDYFSDYTYLFPVSKNINAK